MITCPNCAGRGRKSGFTCKLCQGAGKIEEDGVNSETEPAKPLSTRERHALEDDDSMRAEDLD